jgi:hypothetical protein
VGNYPRVVKRRNEMDEKTRQFVGEAKEQGYTWFDISALLDVGYQVKGIVKHKQALIDTAIYKQYFMRSMASSYHGDLKNPWVTARSLLVEEDEILAWKHKEPNKTLGELLKLLGVYYKVKFTPNITEEDYEQAEALIAWVHNRIEENFGPKAPPKLIPNQVVNFEVAKGVSLVCSIEYNQE